VATGRQPNLDLDLDKAGVDYNTRGIKVSNNCRTNNSKIFAIGDCCDVPRFTHMAGYMGRTLVTNLAIYKYTKIPFFPLRFSTNNIPAVTFTSPELAQSGLTTQEAQAKYGHSSIRTYTLNLSKEDRLVAQNHEIGQVNLIAVGPLAKIVGAHILSTRAGEILPEFQLMITKGMRIKDLGQFVRAYPTYITRVDQLKLEWLSVLFGKLKR
jgi:pyruvate/2-oxoglutarate dehydrogenase complex dihydrolipoamide dehydrogenase (E3) component